MSINLQDIKPHVVSRDLKGKSFLIYGDRKVGKTTFGSKFPDALIFGFEKGWDELDGVMAYPLFSWKQALDLKKSIIAEADEVKAGKKEKTTFQTIIIDTVDIAYDFCESFIVAKEGVDYLDETEAKRGYRATSREFDKFFQEIVKAGYTLICISHSTTKQIKENGQKYDKTIPTIPDRGFLVVSRLVDLCGYATFEEDPENPEVPKRILIMRGSKNLEAGARNKYLPKKILFSYDSLKNAYSNAIDKMKEDNKDSVTEQAVNLYENMDEKADFKETMQEIKKIALVLNKLDLMNEYNKIVAEYLGKNKNVKDCDESQIDIMLLILDDLKDYVNKNKIEV